MTANTPIAENEFDVVIAGAGIIGTSIAFALSQRSYRVLVVDPLAGAGQGATSGSLAMIRTQYSTLEGTALAWEGFHCWKDWQNFKIKQYYDFCLYFKRYENVTTYTKIPS